jgi:hypothetical protein
VLRRFGHGGDHLLLLSGPENQIHREVNKCNRADGEDCVTEHPRHMIFPFRHCFVVDHTTARLYSKFKDISVFTARQISTSFLSGKFVLPIVHSQFQENVSPSSPRDEVAGRGN